MAIGYAEISLECWNGVWFTFLDTIEANVELAHDNVESGRDQLQQAARYQVSYR